jgi:UV DNA damage repair endonuclease
MKNIKRIAFACKWIDTMDQVDAIKPTDDCRKYNTSTTTVAWLNRQPRDVAVQKLWDLMVSNIESVRLLVERVGFLEPHLRMVRLGSDLLPVYTQADWSWFWKRPDVRAYCEQHFARIGAIARDRDVRLSMHPGQFVVLASETPAIVERSLEEFEYHADMARWMGFGREFQDFKINVHISGRLGPAGIRTAYQRLTPEARNCLAIENEEMSHGLDDCLAISDLVAITLDIHHNWIKTGEYISPTDPRIDRVIQSWRGRRPTMHYSISRESVLLDHSTTVMPDMSSLLASGHNRQKLRAHSDTYWNTTANDWALSFLDRFDLMAESKSKNLASAKLASRAQELNLL